MPKVEILDEQLPLGAKPEYSCDADCVFVFVTPSKQVAHAGPGLAKFECPLLKNATKAEIPRLQSEVLKALPHATHIRIVRGADGIGVYAQAVDPSYKPSLPTKIDPKTVGGDADHRRLWEVCRDQSEYILASHQGSTAPNCSGCRYLMPLEGAHGTDWGVCTEPRSPRAGLLTFEHMGCSFFEQEPVETEAQPKKRPKRNE
jgi:hypothetical protein